MFKVNNIVIPKQEENKTPAFQFSGRTIYLVSAGYVFNYMYNIGPNVIWDDYMHLMFTKILTFM